jgi:tRNA U34 5-methylaminomethyl-2-thiouridine-forming methyltransferase MnmC
MKGDLREVQLQDTVYDLVYFDAFSPAVQPELWTEEIFRMIYQSMKEGACLVTYSVKGSVTRALKSAGFCLEKLPGPPGKREMTRATKKDS